MAVLEQPTSRIRYGTAFVGLNEDAFSVPSTHVKLLMPSSSPLNLSPYDFKASPTTGWCIDAELGL